MGRDHFPDAGEFRRSFMAGDTGTSIRIPPPDDVPAKSLARRRMFADWRAVDVLLIGSIVALGLFAIIGRLTW